MLGFILKKLFLDKERRVRSPGYTFRETLETVRRFTEKCAPDERWLVYDYVMDVVRWNLQYDLLTEVLYRSEHGVRSWPVYPFPLEYRDAAGKTHRWMDRLVETREVDLRKECVLAVPWEKPRLLDAILNVGKYGFRFDAGNHRVFDFAPLGVCFVYGGHHSIAAAVRRRKGILYAEVCDVRQLFDHVDTDGEVWLSKHTGERLGNVVDFRIAILYELARMRTTMGGGI